MTPDVIAKSIPDEVVEAAVHCWISADGTIHDGMRAALAAGLAAWPGADVERFMPDSGPYLLQIPLPQDDKS